MLRVCQETYLSRHRVTGLKKCFFLDCLTLTMKTVRKVETSMSKGTIYYIYFTLNMKAVRTVETSVTTRLTTRCNIPYFHLTVTWPPYSLRPRS
jgi:hypothetical protein